MEVLVMKIKSDELELIGKALQEAQIKAVIEENVEQWIQRHQTGLLSLGEAGEGVWVGVETGKLLNLAVSMGLTYVVV